MRRFPTSQVKSGSGVDRTDSHPQDGGAYLNLLGLVLSHLLKTLLLPVGEPLPPPANPMTPDKPISLSPEAREAIERQLEAFRKKFGRDPTDSDPIFFDPDADEPVPLSEEKYERMMIEAMAEVGISQAMIFAFKRTGRIVTERNKYLLPAEELREWEEAIAEYHRRIESREI